MVDFLMAIVFFVFFFCQDAYTNHSVPYIVGSKNEVPADRSSVYPGTPVFRTSSRYEFRYNYFRKVGSAK